MPAHRPIEALLFDLDNTLIDRDAALRAWLEPRVPAHALPALLRIDDGGRGPRLDLCAAILRHAPGLAPDAEALWPLLRDGIADAVRPTPGVREMLLALPHPKALVSDGSSPGQRRKLERAGLSGCFQAIVISGELGPRKPDPRMFRAALEALGVPPDRACMIGDDPQRDIAGARALGLRCVWVRSGRPWPEGLHLPDATLEDVRDLPALLARPPLGLQA